MIDRSSWEIRQILASVSICIYGMVDIGIRGMIDKPSWETRQILAKNPRCVHGMLDIGTRGIDCD